jgi:hypothetical protein
VKLQAIEAASERRARTGGDKAVKCPPRTWRGFSSSCARYAAHITPQPTGAGGTVFLVFRNCRRRRRNWTDSSKSRAGPKRVLMAANTGM